MATPKGLTRLTVAVLKGDVPPDTACEVLVDVLQARDEATSAADFRDRVDKVVTDLAAAMRDAETA